MEAASSGRAIWRTARMLIVTMLVAILVRGLVVAGFVIPSQSMMPGLQVGDFFFATKWDYGYSSYSFWSRPVFSGRVMRSSPRIGDVVIVAGVTNPQITYIKRVMGLPGDLVEMSRGRFLLNGRELPQSYAGEFVFRVTPGITCLAIPGLIDLRVVLPDGSPGCRMRRFRERLPDGRLHDVLDFAIARSDTMSARRVPEGHVFLLGDNRDDSLDSRFSVGMGGLGMVPEDRLLGRARRIVMASDGTGGVFRPWRWPWSVRWKRIGRPVR